MPTDEMRSEALQSGLADAEGDPDPWPGDPFATCAKRQGAVEYGCENPECPVRVVHLAYPAVPPGWWYCLHGTPPNDEVHLACSAACVSALSTEFPTRGWQQRRS